MTIREYLQGLNAYPVPTICITAIAKGRGFDPDSEADLPAAGRRGYMLMKADVHHWLSTAPNVSQGGQSYGFTAEDKQRFLRIAEGIYRRHDSPARAEGKPRFGYRGEFL